ncbi:hypothetical protein ACFPA8_26350 [Streptomyces ovatisporus]|uniref:Integral membrane protein n=1 Tax=Streptomyces ovatisporus TaxID=1128682 RepID=A0ABV9AF96_9ACTN
MTDKDVEQTRGQAHPPKPWWAGTGPWGAAGLVVIGGLAALWAFFGYSSGADWLPFVPNDPAVGYYQAAKVAAIGLVILGSLLLHRRRTRAAATEETGEPEGD